MTTLGTNVKISVPESSRPQVRAMCESLGLPLDSSKPAFDVALTDAGGHLGFQYVADAEALTPAQMNRSVWLELFVADVEASARSLDRIGLARHTYEDKEHPFFVGPGGLVFRLAKKA